MTYKVLSRKWRPKKFDQVIGQNHITKVLQNAIKVNRISHSYLFSGPRGVGKTTIARILASKLNSVNDIRSSLDIIELDGASNRGIDEIRDLKESVNYTPTSGKYKIYIIDEAHMLTKEAFNALLKTLEEPPAHVIFILATTEFQKIPSTISSRCQKYDFKRLTQNDIITHLNFISNEEAVKFEDNALSIVAAQADGSMRDALSLMDKIITLSDGVIKKELIEKLLGVVNHKVYMDILSSINQQNFGTTIQTLEVIIQSGISPNNFVDGFIHFTRNCIYHLSVNKTSLDMPDSSLIFLEKNKKTILKILVRLMNESIRVINSKNILSQIDIENMFIKFFNFDNHVSMTPQKNIDKNVAHSNPNETLNVIQTSSNDDLVSQEKPPNLNEQKPYNEKLSAKECYIQIMNEIENENIRLFITMEKVKVSQNEKSALEFDCSELAPIEVKLFQDKINSIVKQIEKKINLDLSVIISNVKNLNDIKKENRFENEDSFNDNKAKTINDSQDHPLIDLAINEFNGKILK